MSSIVQHLNRAEAELRRLWPLLCRLTGQGRRYRLPRLSPAGHDGILGPQAPTDQPRGHFARNVMEFEAILRVIQRTTVTKTESETEEQS